MKRTIWFWLYFIAAILLAVYFASRIIMTFLGYGSASQVHRVSISANTSGKDLTAIAAAAAVAPGTDTYKISLSQINARVSAVPGVKQSSVRRRPDGNLSVKVKLHRAVAQWTDGENYFPLSDDGTIVRRPATERQVGTILFRGDVPNDITEITKAAHNLISDIEYLEWIEGRRWNIHTTGDITVMLPEQDPIAAISALIVLNKNHQILAKNIRVIDMRDSARTLVK